MIVEEAEFLKSVVYEIITTEHYIAKSCEKLFHKVPKEDRLLISDKLLHSVGSESAFLERSLQATKVEF